ncbi:hypothetical protein ACQBAT_03190 [Ornithinimicrobium sp. Y1847]|uniref:hypothetical protein n=1 Tax=Ornithinimicrobium sp. Y1847 TaxID=3405419 RepID=UPI003B674436
MKTRRTRWAHLATAGALTLTLAACGGGDDDQAADPTTPVPVAENTATDDALTTDAAEDTADVEDTAAATGDAAQDTAAATGDPATAEGEISVSEFVAMMKSPGEEKLSSYTMQMTMGTGAQSMDMNGAVDMSGDKPKFDIDMEMPGVGAMQMLLAEGRILVSMPGVTEEGQWMEIPPDQLGEAASALEEVDIVSQFDTWEQSAKKVLDLGEEDVDGTTLHRYEVTIDGQAILDEAEAQGEDPAQISAMVGDEVIYHIWLDDENLMRKVAFDIGGMVTEMTADNWGEPQDIELPDEADIMQSP